MNSSRYSFHLYEEEDSAKNLLSSWEKSNFLGRLQHRDWSLWTENFQPEIVDRLGWLDLPERMQERINGIKIFAQEIKEETFSDLVLIGMGGSSLAPEVFQRVFKNASGFPKLTVCDSTHPQAVERIRKKLDLRSTLFIASSKSGTTLETLSLFHYFWSEVEKEEKEAGKNFIAVTDYGTPLMKEAQENRFRKIFNPFSDVGGRFSALTEFGLVPASLIGMNIKKLLKQGKNAPELFLGAFLGAVGEKRDKLYLVTSSSLKAFPDWIEQLVAESLGKEGKGIVPVIEEPLIDNDRETGDRFYVFIYLDEEYEEIKELIEKTKKKEIPFVEIRLQGKYDLGREIINWETAVAAAGSFLNIHPFNQPNVQAAKDYAKEAMDNRLQRKIDSKEGDQTISTENEDLLKKALVRWLSGVKKRDYAAVQAYLAPSKEIKQEIQKIRREIKRKHGISTTMGYGPRFLHSTGQLHKGGPDKGIFLQIVDTPQKDIQVPEKDYSFGSIIKAQSLGDFQAIKQENRRILRIDLLNQPLKGLQKLVEMIKA